MEKKSLESGNDIQQGNKNEYEKGRPTIERQGDSFNEKSDSPARKPAVSGMFYPSKKEELEKMVKQFLADAKPKGFEGSLRAIVSPHAGYIYSGPVAGEAYAMLQKLDQEKEWGIIVIGPSHQYYLAGFAASGSRQWETPLGKVATQEEGLPLNPKAHSREHSIEVQLPFLQCSLKKFYMTPIVFGNADYKVLAEKIIPLLDENTIIIASSDLSHYYPYNQALEIDAVANSAIPALDIATALQCEACGLTGILALMHITKKMGWHGEFVDYKNSGDTAGGKESVVGYGAYAFYK